jgi:Helix-turn-helix domain
MTDAPVGVAASGRAVKPVTARRRPRIDRHEPRRASQTQPVAPVAVRPSLAVSGGDVAVPSEPLWTVRDVSEFLRIPVSTLHQWRYEGRGPDAYRIGKHLRYDPAAVRVWLDRECRPARA